LTKVSAVAALVPTAVAVLSASGVSNVSGVPAVVSFTGVAAVPILMVPVVSRTAVSPSVYVL
jgi:hypothetical protein